MAKICLKNIIFKGDNVMKRKILGYICFIPLALFLTIITIAEPIGMTISFVLFGGIFLGAWLLTG